MIRTAAKTVTGRPAVDGAGVHMVRVFGNREVRDFDPFLLLDAFDSTNPADYVKGFPWHPHRGIETITYLSQGIIEHGDSLGNGGVIASGCCQWMTAGSGIIHQEMPKEAKRMLGLQIWLNMPAAQKMSEPQYNDLDSTKIPEFKRQDATIRLISGVLDGREGAMRGRHVDAMIMAIHLEPGGECSIPVEAGHTAFVYGLEGSFFLSPDTNAQEEESRRAIILENGDSVYLKAGPSQMAHCVLCAAPPLGEPIAWGGPIVMNTEKELQFAFEELDRGTFIKHKRT